MIYQDNESWNTSNHCTNEETDSLEVQYLEVLTVVVSYYNIHCYIGNDSNGKEYYEQSDTITIDFRHGGFLF